MLKQMTQVCKPTTSHRSLLGTVLLANNLHCVMTSTLCLFKFCFQDQTSVLEPATEAQVSDVTQVEDGPLHSFDQGTAACSIFDVDTLRLQTACQAALTFGCPDFGCGACRSQSLADT